MRMPIVVVALVALAGLARADQLPSGGDPLAAARAEGATVFLLVTEPRARQVDTLRAAALEAQRRTPRSRVVEVDRTAPGNRDVVKTYGLAGATVPLVLVLAPNGAPAGGAGVGPGAADRLVGLVPSPRKADTLLALFQRKAVFVVLARPAMAERGAVLAACAQAIAALKGRGAVVEVDLDDKAEQAFLQVLGADRKATGVVTHVYGLSGQKTGALPGVVAPEALLEAARKKQECCPGGKCG